VAILNANYIARRCRRRALRIAVRRTARLVAHECIIDTRPFKSSGALIRDIAKRLIDYGFHPPTVSFPVAGTLMVEPTESEPKVELDRFVDALIAIRGEIREIETAKPIATTNLLKNAPHPLADLLSDGWDRPTRATRRFPTAATRDTKVWRSQPGSMRPSVTGTSSARVRRWRRTLSLTSDGRTAGRPVETDCR